MLYWQLFFALYFAGLKPKEGTLVYRCFGQKLFAFGVRQRQRVQLSHRLGKLIDELSSTPTDLVDGDLISRKRDLCVSMQQWLRAKSLLSVFIDLGQLESSLGPTALMPFFNENTFDLTRAAGLWWFQLCALPSLLDNQPQFVKALKNVGLLEHPFQDVQFRATTSRSRHYARVAQQDEDESPEPPPLSQIDRDYRAALRLDLSPSEAIELLHGPFEALAAAALRHADNQGQSMLLDDAYVQNLSKQYQLVFVNDIRQTYCTKGSSCLNPANVDLSREESQLNDRIMAGVCQNRVQQSKIFGSKCGCTPVFRLFITDLGLYFSGSSKRLGVPSSQHDLQGHARLALSQRHSQSQQRAHCGLCLGHV